MNTPLVSVVIPCFNQAYFLDEAINSLLTQTYPHIEVIVVDDGSTDNTPEVVSRKPNIRLVRQQNSGLAAARNSGIRESQGEYLVFLDADDRLLPNAIKTGLDCLQGQPSSAFAWGHYRKLVRNGTSIVATRHTPLDHDPYAALLRGNHITMHATVIYRRYILDRTGGFDTSLPVCEDYDLYLRIARQHPIAYHDHVIAEYRRHDTNMSYNSPLMLKTVLSVLRSQWQHVQANVQYCSAYHAGIVFWKEFYGLRCFRRIIREMLTGQHRQAWDDARSLISSVGGMHIVLFSPVWLVKHLVREGRLGKRL